MNIMVLNGPNLNLLGSREPTIYGQNSLLDIEIAMKKIYKDIDFRQTNSESCMLDWIHEAYESNIHIIMNPGAFTHYSYSLYDACCLLKNKNLKLIEVHLSNPYSREIFRKHSVISPIATGVISGFGIKSYTTALFLLKTYL